MVETLALLAATVAFCVVSGFVPFVNTELYLIVVAVEAPVAALPLVVVAAAAGQTIAKAAMFGAAHRAGRFYKPTLLGRWHAKVASWRRRPYWVVFVSAVAGVPPLYVVSVLAGAIRIPFRGFVVATFVGRLLRFAACVSAPFLAKLFL